MRIVDLAKKHDEGLYFQLIGPPDDLPDRGRLRPPANTREEGLLDSWFARRQRGVLARDY
jgi:hypothetical protein